MNDLKHFDLVMDCLSSNDAAVKEKIEKYIIHRKKFGRESARQHYPEVHYIEISDPMLKSIWKKLLNTIDKI